VNSRDRILAALNHQPPDCCPIWETTIWPETIDRWHREGLPAEIGPADQRKLEAWFGLDPVVCLNDLFDPTFGLPVETLEQTAEHRVIRDGYGKTIKEWTDRSSVPQVLEPALRTPADWERLRNRLQPEAARFRNPAAEADYREAAAVGHFTAITPVDPVWFVLYQTLGFELALLQMAKNAGFVAEMTAAYTDFLLAMLDQAHARGYRFDAIWFWSDLCYKGGLLFSPRAAQRWALPEWHRIGEYARAHGMKFIWHCDGDVSGLVPLLLEAGLDAIHPLEARAGNDVRVYKPRWGERLTLVGNIDADILATNDRARIEAEIAAKLPVAARGGGYIYHSDHSIPPTVALDTFRFAVDCARRYGRA
jgi:uroporphyrinogen decarboxylase